MQALGYILHLNHVGGVCPIESEPLNTTIIDHNGLHQVHIRYCKCERAPLGDKRVQLLRAGLYPATVTDPATCAMFGVLEEYHLLNLTGGLNVYDFVGALERSTDPLRVEHIPERYKAMGRMFREWTFLKRLKGSGRGHDRNGHVATKEGECAVQCWACPHDGINLPQNWRDVDAKYK